MSVKIQMKKDVGSFDSDDDFEENFIIIEVKKEKVKEMKEKGYHIHKTEVMKMKRPDGKVFLVDYDALPGYVKLGWSFVTKRELNDEIQRYVDSYGSDNAMYIIEDLYGSNFEDALNDLFDILNSRRLSYDILKRITKKRSLEDNTVMEKVIEISVDQGQ